VDCAPTSARDRRRDAVRPAGSAQALFAFAGRSLGAGRVHQYVQGLDLPVVGEGRRHRRRG
jgi:hypothetical protein